MTFELTGKIKVITPTECVGSKGFKKRDIVVVVPDEKDSKWDQPIKLEFTKDKCELLDGFSVGEFVSVSFAIRGSEHNGRWYVNLTGFKIARVPRQAATTPDSDYERNRPRQQAPQQRSFDADDDIDF